MNFFKFFKPKTRIPSRIVVSKHVNFIIDNWGDDHMFDRDNPDYCKNRKELYDYIEKILTTALNDNSKRS